MLHHFKVKDRLIHRRCSKELYYFLYRGSTPNIISFKMIFSSFKHYDFLPFFVYFILFSAIMMIVIFFSFNVLFVNILIKYTNESIENFDTFQTQNPLKHGKF